MSTNSDGKLSFGEISLDAEKRVVWHNDTPVELPLKAVDLLCALVERRGDVVTKEEIWRDVWNDAFIEESNLTHNIYLLRKAFRGLGAGDLIKTVPRRGYRFTGDVHKANGVSLIYERQTVTDTIIEETTLPEPKAGFFARLLFALAVAVLLFVTGAFALFYTSDPVATKNIETLAVLPFRTLGDDQAAGRSSIGLADLLITRLSAIRDLKVRPASTVVELTDLDATDAGKQLSTDAVLEGTIYRANQQLRITARLIRTADASVIWSGEFQKPLDEEMSIQNELVTHVVDVLTTDLRDADRALVLKKYTDSVDAFRLYELGRTEWNKRNNAGMVEAQRLFRNAIEKDPNFALAYASLASTLATGSNWGEARSYAARALELDPNLAEAHATDGFVKMFGQWRWDEAESAFKHSIELNSGNATAHHWYATLLAIRGRNGEAKAEMQRAIDINPFSYNYLADMGQLYYFAGDNEKAKEYCYRALDLNPDFAFAHQYLHYIYLRTGETEAAIEEIIKSDLQVGPSTQTATDREKAGEYLNRYRTAMRENGLKGYLDLKYSGKPTHQDSFYFYAIKHALLGENRAAIDCLERAAEAKTFLTAFIKAEPIFENLRGDERFKNILQKMSLDG